MRSFCAALLGLTISIAHAEGPRDYRVTARSGAVHLVAISEPKKTDEDTYRKAVGEVCAGKRVCHLWFWAGSAPSRLPLTEEQLDTVLVQWQQNLDSGLRRWRVRCQATHLFRSERECL